MSKEKYIQEIIKFYDILKLYAIKKYCLNEHDACDLVQDVVEKALKIENYENINVPNMLITLLINKSIDNNRKKKVRYKYLKNVKKEKCEIKNFIDGKEIMKKIAAPGGASLKLKIFYLYYIGYKYKEISQMLNMKLGTVKKIYTKQEKFYNRACN